jgi:hypothetical protein
LDNPAKDWRKKENNPFIHPITENISSSCHPKLCSGEKPGYSLPKEIVSDPVTGFMT